MRKVPAWFARGTQERDSYREACKFDVRKALGGNAASQVTALDAVTIRGTQYVAAAWCGPCNPSFPGGGGFKAGIVMLSNSGGSWHATAQACTSGRLPLREQSGGTAACCWWPLNSRG